MLDVLMLALAFGLDYLRRQVSMKRKDYRMRSALRKGLSNPDGVQMNRAPRMIQWQECEPSSVRFS